MKKSYIKLTLVFSLSAVMQSSSAKDWFGGNNNLCNDWPEWTPMYWMEEMSGNNDNCYYSGNGYYNPYQSAYGGYGIPLGYGGAYGATNPNPYSRGRLPAYGLPPSYIPRVPRSGFRSNRFPQFGNRGLTGFPSYGSAFSNPFSSFSGSKSPFSSFSGGSPWNSYSPLGFGGVGGMPGMSPMSPFSPMGGFGSPMSMGGMPGMTPFSSFGGNPFGGTSSFSPFR